MLQWIDVLNRIAAGESEETEFKRGVGDMSQVGKAVCAFANTHGGVLILGVEENREIVGVAEDAERLQECLSGFLQSGMSSPVSARLGRHEDPTGWVHWIEVPRQRGFEPLRYDGRVWVRRGRASVEPSAPELQDLYNAFGYILTEERYIEAASVDDIDLGAFRAYLAASGLDTENDPQPTSEDDLRNRGVVTLAGAELHPSLYGVMAFGKEPQRFPQTGSFWIECVAYVGQDRASDAILTGEAKGRLNEQVDRAAGWVAGLGKFERYKGLIRTDVPLVPRAVLREVLVNAVAHRDYAILGSKVLLEVFSDRLDVTSPGTLPNGMTPQAAMAGAHPRSRNELMANYLLALGMMEQRGRGWPIIRKRMQEFSGHEPTLHEDRNGKFVRVSIPLAGV